ncbi:MAG: amino acid adenylation domain-containing protein, partial [Maribacter sp.]|nr:amino acid adenylation domain-containing protein [Maribacter sp.]
ISRMLEHYRHLLEGIVIDPSCRISELSLLADNEKKKLLVEWNNTATDYPKDICIHELFEQQVKSTPEALAVICEGKQLTYQELNQTANQLARYILSRDVHSGMLIGIFIDRSIEMVTGLLGVLKAGCAFVPLDPDYPQDRLAFMLEDTGISMVLTTSRLQDNIPSTEINVICFDSDRTGIAQESIENPKQSLAPDSPACVIYTSGSTGRPKGVVIQHSSVVNRLNWMYSTYPFSSEETCCQKTSINFIDSLWEIFGPLSQGIQLVIIPDQVVKDISLLFKRLEEYQVTRITLVPSLLRAILELSTNIQDRLPKLKMWITSGEALSVELARRFQQECPESILLNLYGSTEVMGDVTWYEVKQLKEDAVKVPIGRPIANTKIFILDSYLQPAPIGVTGELHVSGVGLAQGYLNNTELTAEKFISNPFSSKSDPHLFKTGDLAHYLPSGDIELDGRIDHQVKIRGFRIEPGEIEVSLQLHPDVGEAVVIAREDNTDDKRLVAYFVTESQQSVTAEKLRRFLEQELPEYMIPSAFVALETIPLTMSGKIDYKSLPEPDIESNREGEFIAPRNQTEIKLAEIWQKVLGIEKVGVHDNFFHLGGHSLLAVKLFFEISKTFDVELPIATLFEYTTVKGLSLKIKSLDFKPIDNIDEPWDTSVVMHDGPENSAKTIFIVGGVGGNVNNLYELSRNLGKIYKVIGIQTRGVLNHRPHNTVEEMAVDNIQYIKKHQHQGPYYIMGYSGGVSVALEIVSNLEKQGNKVKQLGILDMAAPNYNYNSSMTMLLKEKVIWHISHNPTIVLKKIFNKIMEYGSNLIGVTEDNSEAMQKYLSIRDHQFIVLSKYDGNEVQSDIKLFRCPPRNSREVIERRHDETCGWNSITDGAVDVFPLERNHLEILEGDYAYQLSEIIIKSIK